MRRTAWLVGLVLVVGSSSISTAAPVPEGGPKCGTAMPPAASTPTPDDGVVRVANLNVLHGLTEAPPLYPTSSTLNLRTWMAAEQIAGAGLDIVGMEEVSVVQGPSADPHHPLDVTATLAERTATVTGVPWHWCWFLANPHFPVEPDLQPGGGGPISDAEATLVSQFTGAPYASFKEGLAILSRYPIVDSAGMHLPGRLPIEAAFCPLGSDPSSDPAELIAQVVPGGLTDTPLCAGTVLAETRAALWARIQSPAGYVDLTTTHLAHHITAASDLSKLQQASVALAFADARASASSVGTAQHRFFTCDCNSQPADAVPVVGLIEARGWVNTLPGDCAHDHVCTSGPDVIVTTGPSRAMDERIDYVFAHEGTCSSSPNQVVNTPLAPGGEAGGITNRTGGYLWPTDHSGVSAALAAC